jgi:hypothetical protein
MRPFYRIRAAAVEFFSTKENEARHDYSCRVSIKTSTRREKQPDALISARDIYLEAEI